VEVILYIVLGLLVVAVVAMQVWIGRSQAPLAGDRGVLVRGIRIGNAVLLVCALLGVVYWLAVRG